MSGGHIDVPATPLVLVTVGSEHHRFDRMVAWVEAWLRGREGDSPEVRCVMQYGTAAPPELAEGYDFVDHHKLQALMHEATAIVTQGGPMSILEARRCGTVPIVVPRDPHLGEHVDGHQQLFAHRMAAEGLAKVPTSAAELAALLDRAISTPAEFAAPMDDQATERVEATTARFANLVSGLVARPVREQPRLVLVVGLGPGGSDLFERALSDVPGVITLGETMHVWENGLRDNGPCGCGETFSTCPFWTAVGQRAFGGWGNVTADEVMALRDDVVRNRFLPELLGRSARIGWRLRRDHLARLLRTFYEAASAESDSAVLVDTSASPAYAALLTRAGVQLHFVQLVHDRGEVALSSRGTRRRRSQDLSQGAPSTAAHRSALGSSIFDVLLRRLGRKGVPITSVRYEDFVADPRSSVTRALRLAGHEAKAGQLDHLDDLELLERDRLMRHPIAAPAPVSSLASADS